MRAYGRRPQENTKRAFSVADAIAALAGEADDTLCRVVGLNGRTCCVMRVTGGRALATGHIDLTAYDPAAPTFTLTTLLSANGATATPGATGVVIDTTVAANAVMRTRVNIPVAYNGLTLLQTVTAAATTPTNPTANGALILAGLANATNANLTGLGYSAATGNWQRTQGAAAIGAAPVLTLGGASREALPPPNTYQLNLMSVVTRTDNAQLADCSIGAVPVAVASAANASAITDLVSAAELVYPVLQTMNGASNGRIITAYQRICVAA